MRSARVLEDGLGWPPASAHRLPHDVPIGWKAKPSLERNRSLLDEHAEPVRGTVTALARCSHPGRFAATVHEIVHRCLRTEHRRLYRELVVAQADRRRVHHKIGTFADLRGTACARDG